MTPCHRIISPTCTSSICCVFSNSVTGNPLICGANSGDTCSHHQMSKIIVNFYSVPADRLPFLMRQKFGKHFFCCVFVTTHIVVYFLPSSAAAWYGDKPPCLYNKCSSCQFQNPGRNSSIVAERSFRFQFQFETVCMYSLLLNRINQQQCSLLVINYFCVVICLVAT